MSLPACQITSELFTIPVNDAYLVYAPRSPTAFVANRAVVNRIADLRDGTADLADEPTQHLAQWLRQIGIADGADEPVRFPESGGRPQTTQATLFLSTACNLRCSYCYASAGDFPVAHMPIEIARRGIDFVIANARDLGRDRIDVAYHGGGEPTLNWATLTASYDYAHQRAAEHGLRLGTALATNGVLTDDKIDWLVQHLDSASVSCDGLPEVHDANRRTVGGEGTSREVEHTLRRFDDAGFTYGIRVTVTLDQVHRLPESVRHLCEHFRPQQILVEPAYQLGRWHDAPSAETETFLDKFRQARACARQLGFDVRFSAARAGLLCSHFCQGTQGGFSLTTDGKVSACHEVFHESLPHAQQFLYGHYDGQGRQFRFQLPVLDALRQRTVDTLEDCGGCFAKWSCGGDCYYKCLAASDRGVTSGSGRCHIIRELTKDQILESIEASDGLVWYEPRRDGQGDDC